MEEYNLRDKVRPHVFYKIGDCKTISAWYETWCKDGPLSTFITTIYLYDASMSSSCKVVDLIINGKWGWPIDWNTKFPRLNHFQVPSLKT